MDIRGLFTRPKAITYRQVMVRIRHLPEDSALAMRGLAGETKNSFYDHMWVGVLNELRVANYLYVSAHSGKDRTPEKPNLIELEN
jgi:hypothetical protein